MRKLFFAAALCASAAFAQTPTVSSFSPTSGPDAGGTEITIGGSNLSPSINCFAPCPTLVSFGNITVEPAEESRTRLVVVTPAHAAGTVDMTISVPGEQPLVLHNAFTFIAGPEAAYEKVLLPVYVRDVIAGQHDSLWRTDLWIRNNGSQEILHNPEDLPTGTRSNVSQLLYIEKSKAADVSLGLRVADISRSTRNAGTDVPAVREGAFLTKESQLFHVPMSGNFRVLLRIYDLTYTHAWFRVTLWSEGTDAEERVWGMDMTAQTPQSGPLRTEAAYGELDVSGLLQLQIPWPEAVRIQIDPLTPGSRYWALASITNNETQLVTLVTPQ